MSSEDEELQRIYDNWQLVEQRKRAPAIEREIWVMASRRLFAPGMPIRLTPTNAETH